MFGHERRDGFLDRLAIRYVEPDRRASAIVGASRPDQLDGTLAGADLQLDDELRELCDSVWWQLPRRPVIEGYR
jgi:aryl-alcohol dehydrogenase-like predicted oxidoreductase